MVAWECEKCRRAVCKGMEHKCVYDEVARLSTALDGMEREWERDSMSLHGKIERLESQLTASERALAVERGALEDAKERLKYGSSGGVFWRDDAIEVIDKVLSAHPAPTEMTQREGEVK